MERETSVRLAAAFFVGEVYFSSSFVDLCYTWILKSSRRLLFQEASDVRSFREYLDTDAYYGALFLRCFRVQ